MSIKPNSVPDVNDESALASSSSHSLSSSAKRASRAASRECSARSCSSSSSDSVLRTSCSWRAMSASSTGPPSSASSATCCTCGRCGQQLQRLQRLALARHARLDGEQRLELEATPQSIKRVPTRLQHVLQLLSLKRKTRKLEHITRIYCERPAQCPFDGHCAECINIINERQVAGTRDSCILHSFSVSLSLL